MTDLPAQKRIDADAIASEVDANILRTASALRERYKIVPRIVEVAHGDEDFDIPENYIGDSVKRARAVGIDYEIESVGTSPRKLSDRMAILSSDPSVHGIRVSGWRLQRGEETYEFGELAPAKDIDCRTSHRLLEELRGGSMCTEPSVGAIRRLIRSVITEKPRQEISIAILGQLHEPVMQILVANNYYGTVIKSESIRSENIDLVRSVDVIVTSLGPDNRYLGQGQVIVNRNLRWDSREPPPDLTEAAALMRAFATWRSIFTLASRERFMNLLRGIIWRQGGLRPKDSSELDRFLR
jgi:5,10-methylene-tetrahydrofolate dehydrogenase/methenyl tetrahydrofolate cyclohydrolase